MNEVTTTSLTTIAKVNDIEYYTWIDMLRGVFYIRRIDDNETKVHACEIHVLDGTDDIVIERSNNRQAFTLELFGGIPDHNKIIAIIEAFFGEGKHTISENMWNYICSKERMTNIIDHKILVLIQDESYIDCNDVSTPSYTAYIFGEHALYTVEATNDARKKLIGMCDELAVKNNIEFYYKDKDIRHYL